MVEHIDVQLALAGQACNGEVAAADKAGDRVVDVVAEQQYSLACSGYGRNSLTTTFPARSWLSQFAKPASSLPWGCPA
jgi:hypothetical protein